MLGLRPDKDGNMWLGMMYQGAMAKFDIKDKKFTTWSMPPEMQKDQTQVNMVRAEQLARRRQGLVAEQRLRRDPPARPQDRPDRVARAVQGGRRRRDPQHLRRDPRLQEQRLLHRHRRRIHRQGRQGHDEGHAVPDAEEAGRAAPRHDGRPGPHLVRRIPRQPHRHVRHQDRDVQGMGPADAVVEPLRRRRSTRTRKPGPAR